MTEFYTPIPHKVIVVSAIPPCNFCEDGTPGPYDFATRMGPWANGCEHHWKLYRAALGLGTGMGQLWITEDQVARTSAPEPPERESTLDRVLRTEVAAELDLTEDEVDL